MLTYQKPQIDLDYSPLNNYIVSQKKFDYILDLQVGNRVCLTALSRFDSFEDLVWRETYANMMIPIKPKSSLTCIGIISFDIF